MIASGAGILEQLAGDPERVPAAVLLTGTSEAELERASRRLAAKLLCPGEDPDLVCASCRRVFSGLHPDFLSVEPEGLQIRIDRVRDALVFGAGRPYESKLRVARIVQADLLGLEASNALLKSLEEPGLRFRWILASAKPELLLSTIRSRVARVALPAQTFAQRQRGWEARGFSPEDARDLVLFDAPEEHDPRPRLAQEREWRQTVVAALQEGLVHGRLTSMLLLAERLDRDPGAGRVLAELLADSALSTASAEAVRHGSVAGTLASLARRVQSEDLRSAALAAADPPADRRRGNRRLHYEKLLVELWSAARREA